MVKKHFTAFLILTFAWVSGGSSVFGQVQNRPARASAGSRGISNTDLAYLVTNAAVVKELAISPDAYDKLVQATESLHAELRLASEDFAGQEKGTPGSDADRRKLIEVTKSAQEAFLAKVKEILTPVQFARVQQITYHSKGVAAFNDPAVAELLAITPEQQQQIARIRTESSRKTQAAIRERNGDGRAVGDKLEELGKERDTQILGVLTTDQVNTWAKIKGKDFDLTRTRGAVVARGGNDQGGRVPLTASQVELNSISQFPLPFSGGMRDVLSIVVNEEVAKELTLSEDVSSKLKKLAIDRNAELREATAFDFRSGGRPDADEVKTFEERTRKIVGSYVPQVKGILTPEQYTRAQQICWQGSPNAGYSDPEFMQALGLTKEQQGKITAIIKESQEKSSVLSRSGSIYEQGTEHGMRMSRIADVLTDDQTAKLKTLKGERFDLGKLRGRARSEANPIPFDLARTLRVQPDVFAMAANEAVVQELGLNDETAAKVKKVIEEKNTEIKKATDAKIAEIDRGEKDFRGLRRIDFAERQKRIHEVAEAVRITYVPKIKEVLTAEQFTRLQQITWQIGGESVLLNPEVVQLLSLTQEQQDRIVNLLKESFEKRRAVVAIVEGNTTSATEREAAVEGPRKQIPAVLTVEQTAKWEGLKGKPFDRKKMRVRSRAEQRKDDDNCPATR